VAKTPKENERFYQNKHVLTLLGEEVKVFQTANSGGYWHMRFWIVNEGKAYQRSLRTKHFETACERAQDIFLDTIRPKLKNNQKVFPTNFYDALNQYADEKQAQVGKRTKKGITEGRFTTIKSQLQHIKKFIGYDCTMDELHVKSFAQYAQKRFDEGGAASTIANEQSTLNSFCKFCWGKGYVSFERFELDEIQKDKVDNRKVARATFTDEEYAAITKDLISYTSKRAIKENHVSEADAWTRVLFRHYCLIAANTGMRTSELWGLRWENVQIRAATTHKDELVAQIHVEAETTKVRQSRDFVARGGQHFKRLLELTPFSKPTDCVFTLWDGRRWSKNNRRSFDYQYHKLMERVGITDWKQRNLTSYSFRHYCITKRILEGANPFVLAKDMGTSLKQFEKTYFHVDMRESERNSLVMRKRIPRLRTA
jgi:integrase